MSNSPRSWEQQYGPFVLAILAVIVGSFPIYDIYGLVAFVLIAFVYLMRRYDARILIGLGLVLMALGMVQRALGREVNATKAGNIAYYFLVTGIFCEVVWHLWRTAKAFLATFWGPRRTSYPDEQASKDQ